jgi:hypothetical protein
MNRTWTLDALVDACEAKHIIDPPFSLDERALALSVAAAWHFALTLQELPGRCPDGSAAHGALLWGCSMITQRRKKNVQREV